MLQSGTCDGPPPCSSCEATAFVLLVLVTAAPFFDATLRDRAFVCKKLKHHSDQLCRLLDMACGNCSLARAMCIPGFRSYALVSNDGGIQFELVYFGTRFCVRAGQYMMNLDQFPGGGPESHTRDRMRLQSVTQPISPAKPWLKPSLEVSLESVRGVGYASEGVRCVHSGWRAILVTVHEAGYAMCPSVFDIVVFGGPTMPRSI